MSEDTKPQTPAISQEVKDQLVMRNTQEIDRAGFPSNGVLQTMVAFADTCVKTGQMPKTIDTVHKAVMVFQAGREFGIPPIESLNSFYFVNNKLSLYGAVVMRRIREVAKCKIEYGKCDDTTATVTITRSDDGTSLSATVTMAELDTKGVTSSQYGKKDTFKKHPRTMLIYKAIGEIVRHIAPEALGSLSMETDYQDEPEAPKRKGSIDISEKTEALPEAKKETPAVTVIPTADEVNKSFTTDQLKQKLIDAGVAIEGIKNKREAIDLYIGSLKGEYPNSAEEVEAKSDE